MAPFQDIFKIISAIIKIADITLKARALRRRRNGSKAGKSSSSAMPTDDNGDFHIEQEYDSAVDGSDVGGRYESYDREAGNPTFRVGPTGFDGEWY